MRAILVIVFVGILGCGEGERDPQKIIQTPGESRNIQPVEGDPRQSFVIIPELLGYVESFETTYEMRVNTPMAFADLDQGTLGVCIKYTAPGIQIGEIYIDQESFRRLQAQDPVLAQIVIFHELGHCELNRDHTIQVVEFDSGETIPFSMMFPNTWNPTSVYRTYYQHYLNELAGRPRFRATGEFQVPTRDISRESLGGGWEKETILD